MNTSIYLIFLLLTFVLNDELYPGAHRLILDNENTSLDGQLLSEISSKYANINNGENIIYYEKEIHDQLPDYGEAKEYEMHTKEEARKENLVTIIKEGTYIVSGNLRGQLAIELDKKKEKKYAVTLVLNGVNINSTIAPGIIFYKAYEIDPTKYEKEGKSISLSDINNLKFNEAGAKVILADDSTNTVIGSHVPRCYEYEIKDDGTVDLFHDEKGDQKKRAKYDGAFYSKISMVIKGERKGNGKLNIIADNEGLSAEQHF